MRYGLVWFKRDLRWQDNAALAHASKNGPVRCIYIVEPELWLQPDCALQHFEFIRESLLELDTYLRTRGGCIESLRLKLLSCEPPSIYCTTQPCGKLEGAPLH